MAEKAALMVGSSGAVGLDTGGILSGTSGTSLSVGSGVPGSGRLDVDLDGVCASCRRQYGVNGLLGLPRCRHGICVSCLYKKLTELKDVGGPMMGMHDVDCPACAPGGSHSPTQEVLHIYIEATTLSHSASVAVKQNRELATPTDPRFELDFGRLAVFLAGGRTIASATIYGDKPSGDDTIWSRSERWAVKEFSNQAQSLGACNIVADIIERVFSSRRGATIVLLMESRSIMVAVEKVLRTQNWNIEISGFQNNLFMEMDKLMKLKDNHLKRITVSYLDSNVERIGITRYWVPVDERLSSGALTYCVVIPGASPRTPGDQSIVPALNKLLSVPFMLKNLEDGNLAVILLVDRIDMASVRRNLDMNLSMLGGTSCTMSLSDYEEMRKLRAVPRTFKDPSASNFADPYHRLTHSSRATHFERRDFIRDDLSSGSETSDSVRPAIRSAPLYIEPGDMTNNVCRFGKKCKNGLVCSYRHTTEEFDYFQSRPSGRGNPTRKTSMCHFFKTGKCQKPAADCDFAHGSEDAHCRRCKGHAHFEEDCTVKEMRDPLLSSLRVFPEQ